MTAVTERLRGQVAEAVAGISPLPQLGEALSHGLGTAVPHDGWVLASFDPASGVRIRTEGRGSLSATQARLAMNETVDRDAIRFTDLVRQAVPAGVLGNGAPYDQSSARLHELMRPEGFGSELRVCLRHRGALWGGLILLRRDDLAPFGEEDAALAAHAIAPAVANLRPRPPQPSGRNAGPPPSPGVVILNETNTVETTSRQAETWLAEMSIDATMTHRVIYDLGLATRHRPETATAAAPLIARIQTNSGRWLALQAEPLDDQRIAVTLYPPTPRELLPAFAAWNSYTPRECTIVASLLDGLASKQIARQLNLSIHTVDCYLTSIFRKTDATGREDLLAQLLN